jgi:ubiquitin-protein ligase
MRPAGDWDRRGVVNDLNRDEQAALLGVVADMYGDADAARNLLQAIGFPRGQIPPVGNTAPRDWWQNIFNQLQGGVVAQPPFLRLLQAVIQTYQHNRTLRPIAIAHGILVPDAPDTDQPADDATVRVIVRTSSTQERENVTRVLREVGLDPAEAWSTPNASSYRVNSTDPQVVWERLGPTGLGWIVVPPGEPDYLLHRLIVQGPDGRQFRVTDAPAQQRVGDLAASVVEQYPEQFTEGPRPTVVDHVGTNGQGQRLDPDESLHDAGIQDGDSMRVGFEATAGSVNPIDHQNALDRVRNEIKAFADGHPEVYVEANSPLLPTYYTLHFEQDSFGPPAAPGGQPVEISRHEVSIELGPDFPETPPACFWQTSIFHPNVYPNYDSDAARDRPALNGYVCLGDLAESWRPNMDFGELCQLLIDLAGYRNYDLFEVSEQLPGGTPKFKANFFDVQAALWALQHQEAIEAIGGKRISRVLRVEEHGYPNVVEALD